MHWEDYMITNSSQEQRTLFVLVTTVAARYSGMALPYNVFLLHIAVHNLEGFDPNTLESCSLLRMCARSDGELRQHTQRLEDLPLSHRM
jgi:hypothetical protein